MLCKKGVFKNVAKITGKHLCQNLFFNKVAGLGFCYYNTKYTIIKYTINNSLFLGNKCVTLSEGFKTVCLTKNVLKIALSALNNLRGDNLTETSNYAYRYADYKQYTCWVHNNLGKEVCKVIPSCAVWAIRINYPSKDGKYIPFMESKEIEKRLIEEN